MEIAMRTQPNSEVIDQDRRRFMTAAALGLAAAAAAGTAVLATGTAALAAPSIRSRSLFGRSTRDGRRHGGESPEPSPYSGNGHWPGARYDQNGYYIDPNSPGRW